MIDIRLFQKLKYEGIRASGHFSDADTELFWVLTDDGTLTIIGKGDMSKIDDDFGDRVDETDYDIHAFYYPIVCCYPWFAYHDAIKTVVIGEGIESIQGETFMRYVNIERVILPSTLKELGYWTFYHCWQLREVVCFAEVPADIDSKSFEGIAKDAVLYVPEKSVEAYRQDANWNKSFNEIRGISQGNREWINQITNYEERNIPGL